MFMNKVVCELQLSIQESKGKEKNYYTFSHFIYELTRGNFGIISQCAIMISQLDPMISSCDKLYYEEKNKTGKSSSNINNNYDQKKVFYCVNRGCQKLVINEDVKLFPNS